MGNYEEERAKLTINQLKNNSKNNIKIHKEKNSRWRVASWNISNNKTKN